MQIQGKILFVLFAVSSNAWAQYAQPVRPAPVVVVPPTTGCVQGSPEYCNGIDDNCNGVIDEACLSGPPVAVPVRPPVGVVPGFPVPPAVPGYPGMPMPPAVPVYPPVGVVPGQPVLPPAYGGANSRQAYIGRSYTGFNRLRVSDLLPLGGQDFNRQIESIIFRASSFNGLGQVILLNNGYMIGSPQNLGRSQYGRNQAETLVFDFNGVHCQGVQGLELRLQGDVTLESITANFLGYGGQRYSVDLRNQTIVNDTLHLRQLLNLGPESRGQLVSTVILQAHAAGYGYGAQATATLIINGLARETVSLAPLDSTGRNGFYQFNVNQVLDGGYNGIQSLQLRINGNAQIGLIRAQLGQGYRRF